MKLDPTVMRTMTGQDFRVLEAVEKGMLRHALVPVPLIASLASLRHGGTGKILSSLLRDKLLSHDKSCGYDGYRITNAGYDILALHNLKSRKFIAALGDKIGTGKESDVYLGVTPQGRQVVLKFHRLGRTSFRNVKKTRDYFVYRNGTNHNQRNNPYHSSTNNTNQANSWLFLSRKSALKEYAFMKSLHQVGYPTPEPLAHSRHVVVMSLVRGVPLYQVVSSKLSAEQAASIFHQASSLALRLAKHGLVHCDLNEFNLIVDLSGIQQSALDQEHDPYVRHSGMSVAAESTPGMLSARGPWEQQTIQHDLNDDGSNELSHHEPAELLENGEAKPIVTLIDFPQMVSTKHPNAKELYERDMACLYRFFTHKLHCHIPDEELEALILTWDRVLIELEKANQSFLSEGKEEEGNEDGAGKKDDDERTIASMCLASKAQLRLDEELKASGYSEDDANRDLELYYYDSNPLIDSAAQTREEIEAGNYDDDDDDDNGQDDEHNYEHDDDIDDNNSVGSTELLQDNQSTIKNASRNPPSSTATTIVVESSQLTNLTKQQLQEQAQLRVRQQLDARKKKGRQRGAFAKHNSNKSYVKGKRVYADFGL